MPTGTPLAPTFDRLFGDHRTAFDRVRLLPEPTATLAESGYIGAGRRGQAAPLLRCGKGGSAADCRQIASDTLLGRLWCAAGDGTFPERHER